MPAISLLILILLATAPCVVLAQGAPGGAAANPTLSRAVPGDTAPTASADSAGRLHRVVFKGTAPAGARVSLDSAHALADSAGRWSLTVALDSAARAAGRFDLCLDQNGNKACTLVQPRGFDTLELAPLRFTERLVVDTLSVPADSVKQDSLPEPARKAKLLDDGKAKESRTVVVRGRRKAKVLGQERVTVQQIRRLPGLAEPDVIRAVQALPGVVASSDFSTKMYVRGSASDENLVLYDNAVVYSPAHFGGLFSTFLADAVGGLDFYKGGFDPYWGDRLASVLTVHSKDGGSTFDSSSRLAGTLPGDSAKVTGIARVTTFSGSIETDGRKGDWSWALAGRRTWIDQALRGANKLGLIDFTLSYFFYDWQGDLAWTHGRDTVRVSAYQGRDDLNLDPLILNWGNQAFPLNAHLQLTPTLAYEGTIAWSGFDQTFSLSDILRFDNSIRTINSRQGLLYTGIPGHAVAGGYEFNYFWVDFLQGNKARNSYLEDKYSVDLHAAYLQDRWVLNPRHTLAYGLRVYNYPRLQHPAGSGLAEVVKEGIASWTWDPRITYTWRPEKDWRFDAHAGYYHQYLASLRFTDQETPNEFWYAVKGDMKPTSSLLGAMGVEKENLTMLGLTASWQAYYKDVRAIPLFYPNQTTAQIDSLQAQGGDLSALFSSLDGYALGTELDLKREEGAVSGDISYSYSQAVLRHAAFDNGITSEAEKIYYADWNQSHSVKLTANINWKGADGNAIWEAKKKGRYFRTNLQFNYHTGLPYTGLGLYTRPHDAFQNTRRNSPTALLSDDRNALDRPDYMRLDITPFDVGREGHWRFYWTLLNVLNRKNVYLVQVERNSNPPTKTYFYQFPFLPVFLGYEYEF